VTAQAFTGGVDGKELKNQDQALEEVTKKCRASSFSGKVDVPVTGKVCGDKVKAFLRKHASMSQSGANRSGNAAYTALEGSLDGFMKQKEQKATDAELISKKVEEKQANSLLLLHACKITYLA